MPRPVLWCVNNQQPKCAHLCEIRKKNSPTARWTSQSLCKHTNQKNNFHLGNSTSQDNKHDVIFGQLGVVASTLTKDVKLCAYIVSQKHCAERGEETCDHTLISFFSDSSQVSPLSTCPWSCNHLLPRAMNICPSCSNRYLSAQGSRLRPPLPPCQWRCLSFQFHSRPLGQRAQF